MSQFPPPPPQVSGLSTSSSNSKAVAALVLGITSVLCCGLFTGIPAIIFGFLGMQEADRPSGSGKGMAITGIVLGSISVVISVGYGLYILTAN